VPFVVFSVDVPVLSLLLLLLGSLFSFSSGIGRILSLSSGNGVIISFSSGVGVGVTVSVCSGFVS